MVKVCKICKKKKDINKFRKPTYLQCKQCAAEKRSKELPNYESIKEYKDLLDHNKKRCKKCAQIKELKDFCKSGISPKTKKQRYRPECRECTAIYDTKRYRKKYPKKLKLTPPHLCSVCKTTKTCKWYKNGSMCNTCYGRRHRRANPEKVAQQRTKYYAENKDIINAWRRSYRKNNEEVKARQARQSKANYEENKQYYHK